MTIKVKRFMTHYTSSELNPKLETRDPKLLPGTFLTGLRRGFFNTLFLLDLFPAFSLESG
jgi:hypothetical protein